VEATGGRDFLEIGGGVGGKNVGEEGGFGMAAHQTFSMLDVPWLLSIFATISRLCGPSSPYNPICLFP